MSTTNLRTAVKGRLVDVLGPLLATAALDGTAVPVSYAKPGDDEAGREHVWLDQVDGNLEIPVMTAGAKPYQDDFTLDLVIQVFTPGQSAREAEERVGAIWDVILDALRDSTVSGVMLGLSSSAGMQWVEITRLRGPMSYRTPEGRRAVARASLQFHTRIS